MITLYSGQMAAARRSKPVPQLLLKGGSAANDHGPLQTVQCYNRGYDGFDVQVSSKLKVSCLYEGVAFFLYYCEYYSKHITAISVF